MLYNNFKCYPSHSNVLSKKYIRPLLSFFIYLKLLLRLRDNLFGPFSIPRPLPNSLPCIEDLLKLHGTSLLYREWVFSSQVSGIEFPRSQATCPWVASTLSILSCFYKNRVIGSHWKDMKWYSNILNLIFRAEYNQCLVICKIK